MLTLKLSRYKIGVMKPHMYKHVEKYKDTLYNLSNYNKRVAKPYKISVKICRQTNI